MQSLAPFGDHMRVDGLELLREGVEQAPDGTGSEFFNPFVFTMELFPKPADGAGGHEAQIPHGEPRMFSGEFHFSVEREVVADEHARSHDQGGREGFVVGVADADNPRVVAGAVVGPQDLEYAKIPLSFMAEGMGGFSDAEAVGGELGFHFLQQEVMGKREEKPLTEYGWGNDRSRCRFRYDVSLLEVGCLSGIFQRQDVPGCRRMVRQCDNIVHIDDEIWVETKTPASLRRENGC